MIDNAVTDDPARGRFELVENGHLAYADYSRRGQVLVVPHVEADPALRGSGAAGRLMEGIVLHLRAADLKITPLCSYAAAWFRRHPEHGDLLT